MTNKNKEQREGEDVCKRRSTFNVKLEMSKWSLQASFMQVRNRHRKPGQKLARKKEEEKNSNTVLAVGVECEGDQVLAFFGHFSMFCALFVSFFLYVVS